MSIAAMTLMAACHSSSTGGGGTPTPQGSTPTTTSPPVAAGQPPISCSAIPVSLINPLIGGVARTVTLGLPPNGVSCEFANASASKILILNIGAGGTAMAFATSRAIAAQGGRTVASVSGLGSSAFSISRNGVPAGMEVLTAQGQIFTVTAQLPFAQDESLIRQLMLQF